MNPKKHAKFLREKMDEIKEALVEPGVDTLVKYREMVSRYQGLKMALLNLDLDQGEDDE